MRLADIKGIHKGRLKALEHAGIRSPQDLIDFFPRRYLDRSQIRKIGELAGFDEEVTIIATVKKIQEEGFGRNKRLEAVMEDDTGILKCVWFRGQAYFKKFLSPGDHLSIFGQVKRYGRYLSIAHPDIDKINSQSELSRTTGIVPVYPGNNFFKKTWITSNLIQDWVRQVLEFSTFPEFLPPYLLKELSLPERDLAYRLVHVPESAGDHTAALRRFKFEEFYLFELAVNKLKLNQKQRAAGHKIGQPGELTRRFFNEIIPFELTEGQKSALSDIRRDLASGTQMNRLIQGDVGSGKTVVAIGSMLMCIDQGFQAVLMAPTEILAEQHFHTLNRFLEPLDLNIRLITGGQKAALRRDILSDIAGGTAQIIIGTHAVIQETVEFNRLGIAVIDEQHRFGVMQRSVFQQKGNHPHMLVMSATPIPRSLALTLYGDLDISVIKGLPSGRKPIKTAIRGESKREDVYAFLETTLSEGGQAYIVFPLVEESEKLDLKDAADGHEKIKARFPDYKTGLLHGRMKSQEKEDVMRAFAAGEIHILVSTTVIEVGIDVPNASVMIVEHAERFGLSQLHQLRGRIGRGERQSFCILMVDPKQSKAARERLRAMVETNDGFRIAEVDLRLRGPGDFLGTRQSGLPDFKHADIIEDQPLLEMAKDRASQTLQTDPGLQKPEHQKLQKVFSKYFKDRERFYSMG